jgi:citrate lyase subunit beta/citryl-CoA lyase
VVQESAVATKPTLLRSLLFVPGDSERKQIKGLASGADALVLDLEDSVARPNLMRARAQVGELLRARTASSPPLWVRVNSPSSGQLSADIDSVIAGGLDGILLPKVDCADVAAVERYILQAEERAGLLSGSTQLIVIATETPRALLTLGDYLAARHDRMIGMTWGAEDLAAAIGATTKVDDEGELTFTFQLARSICLLTAAALGLQAIDTVYPAFRDPSGLARCAAQARRDGFLGKLAIHPDQVQPINEAFTPTAAEIEHAQGVVAVFAQAADIGVASLDGQMLDQPHLVLAHRVLELAGRNRRDGRDD